MITFVYHMVLMMSLWTFSFIHVSAIWRVIVFYTGEETRLSEKIVDAIVREKQKEL